MAFPDLVFAYPDIPYRAITFTTDEAADTGDKINTIYGNRLSYYRRVSSNQEIIFTYDLGSGVTATAEYLILARIKPFILSAIAGGVTCRFYLEASTNNFSSTTTVHDSTAISSTSGLVGPNGEDYYTTFTESSAFRYWRVRLTLSGAGSPAAFTYVSKIFFGKMYTFGEMEPSYPYSIQYTQPIRDFKSDYGNLYRTRSGKPQKKFSYQWTAVTDSERANFENKIGKLYDVTSFFLVAPNVAFRNPLNDNVLYHAWIDSYEITSHNTVKDNNTITMSLIEDVA
jgi:hypothetical protein